MNAPESLPTHKVPTDPPVRAACRCGWKGETAQTGAILRCPRCERAATPIADRDAGDEHP